MLTIDKLITDCIEQGTLTLEGVGPGAVRDDVVYHSEWAKNPEGHLVSIILAGIGRWYFHDLTAKTLVTSPPGEDPTGLVLLDL